MRGSWWSISGEARSLPPCVRAGCIPEAIGGRPNHHAPCFITHDDDARKRRR
jgi:hypothetical protein